MNQQNRFINVSVAHCGVFCAKIVLLALRYPVTLMEVLYKPDIVMQYSVNTMYNTIIFSEIHIMVRIAG